MEIERIAINFLVVLGSMIAILGFAAAMIGIVCYVLNPSVHNFQFTALLFLMSIAATLVIMLKPVVDQMHRPYPNPFYPAESQRVPPR